MSASPRTTSRRSVELACQAVRERDFKLIADRTLDVSIGGALLLLRTPVLTGEAIILSFQIPGKWIDVEATVARVIHGRRPGDEGRAVGVVFDRIEPSAKAALAAYLHGRTARAPRPRSSAPAPLAPTLSRDGIDGLGILRAVVSAWQDLALATQDA